MPLTVLSVAYSLALVGPASVGGAEQMVSAIDTGLVSRGHRSIVVAQAGSRTRGTLVPTPGVDGPLDGGVRGRALRCHQRAIDYALAQWPVDVVHLHGIDFPGYVPALDVPLMATLHLPLEWYPAPALNRAADRIHYICVSHSQQTEAAECGLSCTVVENGTSISLSSTPERGSYACALGRICPEKAYHEALDAAHIAGVDMLLAGRTFRFEEHEQYFRDQIVPRLDSRRRFVGPVAAAQKAELIAAARCLLVPSRVRETSSLVAMEALALGTPVVAFPSGALGEIVEHGRTGFLVHDAAGMADAIAAVESIDPEACRYAARTRFSASRMIDDYIELYGRRARQQRGTPACA